MNAPTKDRFVFIALLALIVIWTFHISYAINPEVMKVFFNSYEKSYKFITIDVFCLLSFVVCFVVFVGKQYLDSKWWQCRLYRICAIFITNISFLFVWALDFGLNVAFHCRYYWAINCADDPENSTCSNFPIEVDIAYLFFTLPMFFILCLILYYAFHHKILSKRNCIGLTILLIINFISIWICFKGNGVGCYD